MIPLAIAISFAATSVPTLPSFDSTPRAPMRSEQWRELSPILLPESAAPIFTTRAGIGGNRTNAVFRFVLDTLGRVDTTTIETLAAPDSAAAGELRRGLGAVRYVPARLIRDVGRCVRFNGVDAHCGGPTPTIRRVRARVVLEIEASIANQ